MTDTRFDDIYPHGVQLSDDTTHIIEHHHSEGRALTFSDITLADRVSTVAPGQADLTTPVTRNFTLNNGVMTAAMDTVTQAEMALEMAKQGGIGVIHRNMPVGEHARMVEWVRTKIHRGGMIEDPVTFTPDDRISDVQRRIDEDGLDFTSFPIVDNDDGFKGLLTRDEIDLVDNTNPRLGEAMKPASAVKTAQQGTKTEEAYERMKGEVKKLPVLEGEELVGMYVWNDVKKRKDTSQYSLDDDGHFLVGAAIGPEEQERAEALVEAGCRVLVIDSSHGACPPVRDAVVRLKEQYNVDVIAGNVSSYDTALYLLNASSPPDALKVGIGPGATCTTRRVSGHGVPQVTAVYEARRAVQDSDVSVPVIADGGIGSAGEIVKALAVGANAVMMGTYFAGTAESPGEVIREDGERYKRVRGMASESALREQSGSRDRYAKDSYEAELLTEEQSQDMVAEGKDGRVAYKGTVARRMHDLTGGLQVGLGHAGAETVKELQGNAAVWVQSASGDAEGKPDID